MLLLSCDRHLHFTFVASAMPGKIQPTNPKLDAVPDVVIDDNGKFKYIQCKIYDPDKTEDWKYIVRGSNRAEFHCTLNKRFFFFLVFP